MKVPIEVDENKTTPVDANYEVADDTSAASSPADEPCDLDPEEERARVEAAIRAGEEAAERELAADAGRLRAERDELQKTLADAQDDVEAAKAQAKEAADRLLRVQADWDNYRRRTTAEREAERKRAAEGLVTSLLPVIDDLDRAIDHADTSGDDAKFNQFVEGVEGIRTKMLAVLAKQGVEPMCPVGEPFDPLAQQAVGRVEDAESFDETVAQVYQKGYRMGDKVIRTAMVTVTFGGPKRPAEDSSGEVDSK